MRKWWLIYWKENNILAVHYVGEYPNAEQAKKAVSFEVLLAVDRVELEHLYFEVARELEDDH